MRPAMTLKKTTDAAILIVDDEISLRNTFLIFLKRAGYKMVSSADSFEEAIRAVSDKIFDLIICDIVLENHSGIDLLRRLRELGVVCPVIIITGFPHVETASEAVRLGAFDYLAKPVEKEILLKTARLAIQQYHLEIEKNEADLARDNYRQFLETIFSSVSDAIVSVDRELNILDMNNAAQDFFQVVPLPAEENKKFHDLCQDKPFQPLLPKVQTVLKTGTEIKDFRIEYPLNEGGYRLLSICISPLKNGQNAVEGCVLVFRDMSFKTSSINHQRSNLHRLIGTSSQMQKLYMMIEHIGKVDTSVLITGASGTGKELVAEALHLESRRKHMPLIKVNCTALPENLKESELFGHKKGSFTGAGDNRAGRILQADGGTLFLDEIGDISQDTQLKLLRFLQEKTFYPVGGDKEIQVDVRVIAATNADLRQKVQEGSFREDLYYRLLIIDINLPPLYQREGDIALLTDHFILKYTQKMGKNITGISEQAMTLLNRHDWPGNVRQLEHAIERACILCQGSTIFLEHLPEEILGLQTAPSVSEPSPAAIPVDSESGSKMIKRTLTEQEQQATEVIISALIKTGGNKAKAARRLNIDRSTLYRKIKELHIDLKQLPV